MSQPFLSLCLISNDNSPKALPRLLDSVLKRAGGSSADEVLVWWNGEGDRPTSLDDYLVPEGVTLRIVKGEWREDFGWARQRSFEAAKGVWRMYLDCDDVLSMPGDASVARNLQAARADNKVITSHNTLMDYLHDQPPHVNCLYLPYDYSEDAGGHTMQRLWRNRAVRWADGWVWHWAVHEDMKPIGGCVPSPVFNSGLVVMHDPSKPVAERSLRNLRILQRVYEEEGDSQDQRVLYGIGVGLIDAGRVSEGVEWLERALRLKPPAEDAFTYHTLLVTAYLQMGQNTEAQRHALDAVAIYPTRPEGHLAMGEVTVVQRDFARASVWLDQGLRLPQSSIYMIDMPAQRQGFFRAALADCLLHLGDPERALKEVKLAAENAHHPYVVAVERLAQDAYDRAEQQKALTLLVEKALKSGDLRAAESVMETCPAELEAAIPMRQLRERVAAAAETVRQARADAAATMETDPDAACAIAEAAGGSVTVLVPDANHLGFQRNEGASVRWNPERLYRYLAGRGAVQSLNCVGMGDVHDPLPFLQATYDVNGVPKPARGTVVIYSPHYAEAWSPKTALARGVGGSEEAVVYLAPALVKLGYIVEVYAPIPPEEGSLFVQRGVVWRPLTAFDPDREMDHLIAVRSPWIAGFHASRVHVKHLWIWHHDHCYPDDAWGPFLSSKAHHLYVSEWQRRVLEEQGGKTSGAVIYNGVPPEQIEAARVAFIEKGGRRDRFRCVWASMPTRRLDRLVSLWPEIKERWPEATLDIYYGMHTVAQLWRIQSPEVLMRMHGLQASIQALSDVGVAWKDRVGQPALCEAFWGAGVMPYPSDFPETYMIAAARAAACGCVPVVTDVGALAETSPTPVLLGDAIEDEAWMDLKPAFLNKLGEAFEISFEERMALAEQTQRIRSWEGVAKRVALAFDAAETGNAATLAPTASPLVGPPPYVEPTIL